MGIMVYSLLWVVQDFVHQPYHTDPWKSDVSPEFVSEGLWAQGFRLPRVAFKVCSWIIRCRV